MARQRQLERCKWVFWRVSASSFYFDREKAMALLWRKLEELGIHPLIVTQPEATQDTPPYIIDHTRPPPSATPPAPHTSAKTSPKSPLPPRQQDLIPSSQMELPTQKAEAHPNRAEAKQEGDVAALREYIAAAKQKRPLGILVYEEIGHVVLELLPHSGRIDRKALIRNTADVLEFPDVAFKRIDEAIRRLEELKKVCADSNYVWRRTR